MTHSIHHILCVACVCATLSFAITPAPQTGRLHLKVAVINYEPILTQQDNQPYWKACGWTDPREIAPMILEGWRDATDGMVQMEIVYWTDLDMFPYMGRENRFGQRRYTEDTYWTDFTNRWRGTIDAKLGNPGYAMTLTNDAPEILSMVENGEVDHVVMFGGPYFGYWETIMVGKGAYWCNSGPLDLGNERLFIINGMNTERPGTGLHNYGHGLGESGLGAWFFNDRLGYDNRKTPATNANDFVLFTRCAYFTGDDGQPVHAGNTHFTPNSEAHYDYNNTNFVLSAVDQWYTYPVMTNAPRWINNEEWAYGRTWNGEIAANDETFQLWWWHHVPRKMGLHRGRLCNWITYALNPWHASWPIGSDHTCVQYDVDLRGWSSYQVYVPEGTTSVVIRAETGAPVYFGVRKDFVPYGRRPGASDIPAADVWEGPQTAFELHMTPESAMDKTLDGYWYITFGGGDEPWDRNHTYSTRVHTELRPRPSGMNPYAYITAPAKNARIAQGSTTQITWEINDMPQGVRGTRIYYRPTAEKDWQLVCEDFHYQLTSPYAWTVPSEESDAAQIRIEVEDVYGATYSHTSSPFRIN